MDVHEPMSIREALRRYGTTVQVRALPSGDYSLGSVGIERKTISDFMSSMYSGRLGRQIRTLGKCFAAPILLIEGRPELQRLRFNIRSFYGYLSGLAVSKSISVLQTSGSEQSALVIHLIARRVSSRNPRPRQPYVRPARSDDEAVLRIVSSFPGIGPILSTRLLRRFGSLRRLVSASESEISSVEGVGMKTAEKIVRIYTHRLDL